jgi:hypothetical protein
MTFGALFRVDYIGAARYGGRAQRKPLTQPFCFHILLGIMGAPERLAG